MFSYLSLLSGICDVTPDKLYIVVRVVYWCTPVLQSVRRVVYTSIALQAVARVVYTSAASSGARGVHQRCAASSGACCEHQRCAVMIEAGACGLACGVHQVVTSPAVCWCV